MSPTLGLTTVSLEWTTVVPLQCESVVLPWRYQLMFRSYSYDVNEDGTFGNRQLFSFVSVGDPDGKRGFLFCMIMLIFDFQASTVILWVTSMLGVVVSLSDPLLSRLQFNWPSTQTEFKYGTQRGPSSERSSWVKHLQTSKWVHRWNTCFPDWQLPLLRRNRTNGHLRRDPLVLRHIGCDRSTDNRLRLFDGFLAGDQKCRLLCSSCMLVGHEEGGRFSEGNW